MKNSSLAYDFKKILSYVVALSILIVIISNFFYFPLWLEVVVFISLQFILIYQGLKKISAQVELLPKIISLAQEIGNGKFDGRVTYINESTEMGILAWTLNDALDQLEAFTREIKTTVEYMSQGKYFRKLQTTGMHGQFLASMLSVENAIEITGNRTKAEQEYLMRNVQLLLQNMDKLANGDLTVRVEKEKDDVIGSLFN
ncbi:MAG: hypothetical protein Q8Q47_07685, partial [Ignavibacteriaceae bacterium]|nr:hypothetical protein [Ignavibacteriaceae bacterium]